MPMNTSIRLNPADNVAVALRLLARGAQASDIPLRDDIPAGHKFALSPIPARANVIKYGYPIGLATTDIAPGQHVHLHNLQSALDEVVGPSTASADRKPEISNPKSEISDLTFHGFPRPDGRVGIRNEIWVINTVACVNQAAQQIASAAARDLPLSNLNVD